MKLDMVVSPITWLTQFKKAKLHNSRNNAQRLQKEEKDEEFGSKYMAPISPDINQDL